MVYFQVRTISFHLTSNHKIMLRAGAVEDQYDSLHEHFMESREKLFASVEAATATFNTWTTNHLTLLITRVLAGTLGLYVLYAIWSEVW